jgi:hypothetical protein
MAMQFHTFTVRADGLSGKKAFEYEATILGMLRSYEATRMGGALIKAFAFYAREVLVFPYDGSAGDCNGWGDSDWGMFRTKVSFTAKDFYGQSRCYPYAKVGVSPHEVLFHELVHGLRSAARKLNTSKQIPEEDVAIMLANIFSSEIGYTQQRRDHQSLDSIVISSKDFLHQNTPMISAFHKQHPEFCRWVAEVKVPFNPVRSYYQTLTTGPTLVNR